MPPLRRTLPPDPDGQFRLTGTELAFPGVWQIQIAALVNDFVQERGSVEIQVSERGYIDILPVLKERGLGLGKQ